MPGQPPSHEQPRGREPAPDPAARGAQPGKRSSADYNDPVVQEGAHHGRSAPDDPAPRSAEERTAPADDPAAEPADDLVDRRARGTPGDPA
ncbi:MAG TPA: hypothetical protein VFF91_03995 [Pseudoxanthomonas sp.]|nr:hypothetical protein [Pseudoxanthomonas sp.]